MIIDAIAKSFRINGTSVLSKIAKGNFRKGDFASFQGYKEYASGQAQVPSGGDKRARDFVQLDDTYAVAQFAYGNTIYFYLYKKVGNNISVVDTKSLYLSPDYGGDTYGRMAKANNKQLVYAYYTKTYASSYWKVSVSLIIRQGDKLIVGDTKQISDTDRLSKYAIQGGEIAICEGYNYQAVVSYQSKKDGDNVWAYRFLTISSNDIYVDEEKKVLHSPYNSVAFEVIERDVQGKAVRATHFIARERSCDILDLKNQYISTTGLSILDHNTIFKIAKRIDNDNVIFSYDNQDGKNFSIYDKNLNEKYTLPLDAYDGIKIEQDKLLLIVNENGFKIKIFKILENNLQLLEEYATKINPFNDTNGIFLRSMFTQDNNDNYYIGDGNNSYNYRESFSNDLEPFKGIYPCVCMQDGNVGKTIKVVKP